MKDELENQIETLRKRIVKTGGSSKTPDERSIWLRARAREVDDWKNRLGGVDLTPPLIQALQARADACLRCAQRKVRTANEADELRAEAGAVMPAHPPRLRRKRL